LLSQDLISIDPDRARDDPVIVKNIPYYKAKKALEEEVMKLDPPPRPSNWGVCIHYLHNFLSHNNVLSIIVPVECFPFHLSKIFIYDC